MKRIYRRSACALLCAALMLAALCPMAAADDAAAPESTAAPARERPELEDARVYINGLLSGRAFVKSGTAYIALSDIGEMYSVDIRTQVTDSGFTASAPGLELSAERDAGYAEANFRYIYLPQGYITCGQDVYLPLDAIGRIFSLTCELTDAGTVEISTVQVRMISGSEDYYSTHFSADELYWLPHVAYVEALDEPLAGIMGVISVVLNRVESKKFPDTIFEVLYDTDTVVQFTPAATGSMHGKPPELYYIATYLVLEGYNTVGKSTYYVNPANNGNYWFRENRTYVTAIGNHEFYK